MTTENETVSPAIIEQRELVEFLRSAARGAFPTEALQRQSAYWQAADEIERVQASYQCAHNQAWENGAAALRYRTAIINYVRARKSDLGRVAAHWWTLQEIEQESSDTRFEANKGE